MRNSKDFIMTYSRVWVDPFNIQPFDIKIEDIAHSLSMMTRANGHFKHFYSVAQHSINCTIEAKQRGLSNKIQLACLLHDAAEAYIADVPRPVKHRLAGYEELEQQVLEVIFSKFSLSDITEIERIAVKEIDDSILHYEFEELMNLNLNDEKPYISSSHNFSCKNINSVRNNFLGVFADLTNCGDPSKCNEGQKVIGVDGCKGGWVACILDGNDQAIRVYESIDVLCKDNSDAELIIVDMPIGLPENKEEIRPEKEARGILKGKSSSVFNCPCRQAVYAENYDDANSINKKILEKGLSKQSYAIFLKIKEIDVFLRENPHYKSKLVESHPEVCFAMLNGNPVMEKKSTEEGANIRLRILSEYHCGLYDVFGKTSFAKKLAQADDIIDAICLAVVAKLVVNKSLTTIPEKPQKDAKEIVMQMVIPEKR